MEEIRFANFITRGFEKGDDDEKRIFKGHISAEIVDKQNEFIARDEILKKIDLYMKLTRGVSEVHSNRIVGQIDKYEKSEIQGHPSVYVEGHVFKQDGVQLYDQVWNKVKSGEYSGLSMGGASHDREQIVKDGKIAMSLKNLEIYEIALCQTPANPLAIIDYVNQFAKAVNMEDKIKKSEDGRSYIQCNSIECVIEKADMTMPSPIDSKTMYKCGSCGKDYPTPFEKCASCGSSMMKSIEKGTNEDKDVDNDNDYDKKPYVMKIKIDDSDIKKLGDVIKDEVKKSVEYFTKPFAGYENFEACVRANKDKGDPEAYCGEIKHKVEKGIWEQSGKDKDNKDYKELGDTKAKEILDNVKTKDNEGDNDLIKELNVAILKTSLI